jgi:hypothetical protein
MILEYLHKELDKIKKLPRTIEINARYCQCYNNIEKPIDCSYFVNKKCHGVNSNDYIRYLEKK